MTGDNDTTEKTMNITTRGWLGLACLPIGIFGGTVAYSIEHNMIGAVLAISGFVLVASVLFYRGFIK